MPEKSRRPLGSLHARTALFPKVGIRGLAAPFKRTGLVARTKRLALTTLLASAASVATACSSPAPTATPPIAQPPALTATLTSPTNIVLHWPAAGPGIAGHLLEYANAPDGPWTALQFLPPDQTSYTHPDLIPETPFYYRVRPFSGPVSAAVKVGSTAASPSQPAAPDQPAAPSRAAASGDTTASSSTAPRQPSAASAPSPGDAAAPTDLRATPGEDTSVVFTWTDHTTNEAGFLLELRKPGETGFTPVEVTDPNTTTCALSLLPGEQGSDFRVRALSYGPLSPVVHRTTGKD
ncbi:fibronectin type III domain-containing protein [Amycolatopsis sp. NBC_01480]|uniref:fibronectin type III domain-containing protein n=1 Tax=Amycolatopsis sp. NBC_01480 TaxID=2903562 RepID=UPI003FA43A07